MQAVKPSILPPLAAVTGESLIALIYEARVHTYGPYISLAPLPRVKLAW